MMQFDYIPAEEDKNVTNSIAAVAMATNSDPGHNEVTMRMSATISMA